MRVSKMQLITEIGRSWYASSDEVYAFGDAMVGAGRFYDPDTDDALDSLLRYFEKPWHYDHQHAWWVVNDRTVDALVWEDGEEADWEVDE